MTFRYLPIKVWIIGSLLISIGIYLLYHLALGHNGRMFNAFDEGYWWQYFVAIFILIGGIILTYTGHIDSVVLDKSAGTIAKA